MADGVVHATDSLALSPVAAGIAYAATGQWELAGLASAGCIAGVFLTPDLDMPRGGWLWRALWWLYQAKIPHRSRWSHLPILGTAVRLAYLFAVAVLVACIFGAPMPKSYDWLSPIFWGLVLSDTAHALRDL